MAMPESVLMRWNALTEDEQRETMSFMDFILFKRHAKELNPLDDPGDRVNSVSKSDNSVLKSSMRGILSQYANPALAEKEKGAWERAIFEKHGHF